jgi:hypothetical protein
MDDLIDENALAAFGLLEGTTAPAPITAPPREAPRFAEEKRRPRRAYRAPAPDTAPEDEPAPASLRGRLTDPAAVRRYVLGGKGTLTLLSRRSGQRFTFKLGRPRNASDDDARVYVRVLTGPENTADYEWLGTFRTHATTWRGRRYAAGYRHGRETRISEGAPSTRTAVWFLTRVLAGGDALDSALRQCEVWHEGRCGACGRKLTVPESVEHGIGPVCAERGA